MDEATRGRLRAAIGRNADYYLRHWAAMDESGRTIDWNWSACMLNIFWFAWRKMWAPTAGLLLVFVLLAAAGAASPALLKASWSLNIAVTFLTGAWGNWLYRRHIHELVATTEGMDEAVAQERLRRRGGTSLLPPLMLVVLILAVLVAATISALQQLKGHH